MRGLSAVGTGLACLPMMLIGAALTPFAARLGERYGRRTLIIAGLAVMAIGCWVLGVLPASVLVVVLSALMVLVGLAGPLVGPTAPAVLLDAVPGTRAGVASGVFNTGRQIGGALAVAVFGGLLATRSTFMDGVHASLLIAAAVAALAAAAGVLLPQSKES